MLTIMFKKIYKKISNPNTLIFFVWLLMISCMVAIIKIQFFSILFPIIFANIGFLVFIIFRNHGECAPECESVPFTQDKTYDNNSVKTVFLILLCLFLFLYSISLLSLLQEYYTKSILYYLSVSLCTGILVFEILSFKSAFFRYCILFQTFLLSINIVFANHLIFTQGISLPDFGLHFNSYVMRILETGHVSSIQDLGMVYTVFNIHHIFASEITILTGYHPLSVYLWSGSLLIAIGGLFVFIIGKRFVSFQFGLLVSVLFTCLDYFLMYGEHPEHVAYSLGYALIYITIILFTYQTQKPAFYLIFIISSIATIFTHHLVAALTFTAAGSLLIFDIVQFVQKRDRSLPSKYILGIGAFLLLYAFYLMAYVLRWDPVALGNYYISPYLKGIYTLLGNVYTSFFPVSTVPSTPVPISTVPSTPLPISTGPSTPLPISTVPSTPVSVGSQTNIAPMGYDKLSLLTLFENTLGSSLLILTAVLGFCSYIKKRSWFGDIIILIGIILSSLLGVGILFSSVLLLPDRIYPIIQVYCLIFLGAAGILWIYHLTPIKKRTFSIACICTLVVLMSFFSLCSIINGFETSPFIGDNVSYEKIYTTSQDVSFIGWRASFVDNGILKIIPVPVNTQGSIDFQKVPNNSYLFFDRTRLKTGSAQWGLKFGQHSFISINEELIQQLKTGSTYYDNGLIILSSKPLP
jgi:hypothetical protein